MASDTPLFSEGTAPDAPATAPNATETAVPAAPDGFTYVRVNGVVHAVPDAAIVDAPASPTTSVSEAVKYAEAQAAEEVWYVWLANGQVRTVKESDLPTPAGSNAPYGVWVEAGKTYVIAGVYAVEYPR